MLGVRECSGKRTATGTPDKNRRNETGRSPGDNKRPASDALTGYPDDGGATRWHGDGRKGADCKPACIPGAGLLVWTDSQTKRPTTTGQAEDER